MTKTRCKRTLLHLLTLHQALMNSLCILRLQRMSGLDNCLAHLTHTAGCHRYAAPSCIEHTNSIRRLIVVFTAVVTGSTTDKLNWQVLNSIMRQCLLLGTLQSTHLSPNMLVKLARPHERPCCSHSQLDLQAWLGDTPGSSNSANQMLLTNSTNSSVE
jgi:hypothetical protein